MDTINLHSIVVLIGPSGAGKSTLASARFPQHEIISSDAIRAEICGDFRVQNRNNEIFEELHRRAEVRIAMGQRIVIDATNLKVRDREFFVNLARKYQVPLYYLVINRPLEDKISTGGWRLEVNGLIERHDNTFRSNLKQILAGDGAAVVVNANEPFHVVLRGDIMDVVRNSGYPNVMAVGDIHGCPVAAAEMASIAVQKDAFTVYLGDIVDYGDRNLEAFWFVYGRVMNGQALSVWGNHERKIDRWLRANWGATFKGIISEGVAKTINELKRVKNRDAFMSAWNALESVSRQHYVIGDLLFTHGAATPEMWFMNEHRLGGEHGQLAYFGQVDLNQPMRDDGYPNRIYDWVKRIEPGKTAIVGHDIRNREQPYIDDNPGGGRAVFLDTGSGKGGKLSHILFEL